MSQDIQSEPTLSPAIVSSSQLNYPVRVRRPQGKALEILRGYTLERQGPKCQLCPSLWTEIDHKDGNIGNNSPGNIRGLCKPCNLRQRNLTAKNPSGTTGLDCVSVQSNGATETELEKNARTENAWVEFVTAQLSYGIHIPKERLTGNSAYQIGLSVATVNRHWKKYASDLGPFRIYRPNQGTSLLVELRKRPEK